MAMLTAQEAAARFLRAKVAVPSAQQGESRPSFARHTPEPHPPAISSIVKTPDLTLYTTRASTPVDPEVLAILDQAASLLARPGELAHQTLPGCENLSPLLQALALAVPTPLLLKQQQALLVSHAWAACQRPPLTPGGEHQNHSDASTSAHTWTQHGLNTTPVGTHPATSGAQIQSFVATQQNAAWKSHLLAEAPAGEIVESTDSWPTSSLPAKQSSDVSQHSGHPRGNLPIVPSTPHPTHAHKMIATSKPKTRTCLSPQPPATLLPSTHAHTRGGTSAPVKGQPRHMETVSTPPGMAGTAVAMTHTNRQASSAAGPSRLSLDSSASNSNASRPFQQLSPFSSFSQMPLEPLPTETSHLSSSTHGALPSPMCVTTPSQIPSPSQLPSSLLLTSARGHGHHPHGATSWDAEVHRSKAVIGRSAVCPPLAPTDPPTKTAEDNTKAVAADIAPSGGAVCMKPHHVWTAQGAAICGRPSVLASGWLDNDPTFARRPTAGYGSGNGRADSGCCSLRRASSADVLDRLPSDGVVVRRRTSMLPQPSMVRHMLEAQGGVDPADLPFLLPTTLLTCHSLNLMQAPPPSLCLRAAGSAFLPPLSPQSVLPLLSDPPAPRPQDHPASTTATNPSRVAVGDAGNVQPTEHHTPPASIPMLSRMASGVRHHHLPHTHGLHTTHDVHNVVRGHHEHRLACAVPVNDHQPSSLLPDPKQPSPPHEHDMPVVEDVVELRSGSKPCPADKQDGRERDCISRHGLVTPDECAIVGNGTAALASPVAGQLRSETAGDAHQAENGTDGTPPRPRTPTPPASPPRPLPPDYPTGERDKDRAVSTQPARVNPNHAGHAYPTVSPAASTGTFCGGALNSSPTTIQRTASGGPTLANLHPVAHQMRHWDGSHPPPQQQQEQTHQQQPQAWQVPTCRLLPAAANQAHASWRMHQLAWLPWNPHAAYAHPQAPPEPHPYGAHPYHPIPPQSPSKCGSHMPGQEPRHAGGRSHMVLPQEYSKEASDSVTFGSSSTGRSNTLSTAAVMPPTSADEYTNNAHGAAPTPTTIQLRSPHSHRSAGVSSTSPADPSKGLPLAAPAPSDTMTGSSSATEPGGTATLAPRTNAPMKPRPHAAQEDANSDCEAPGSLPGVMHGLMPDQQDTGVQAEQQESCPQPQIDSPFAAMSQQAPRTPTLMHGPGSGMMFGQGQQPIHQHMGHGGMHFAATGNMGSTHGAGGMYVCMGMHGPVMGMQSPPHILSPASSMSLPSPPGWGYELLPHTMAAPAASPVPGPHPPMHMMTPCIMPIHWPHGRHPLSPGTEQPWSMPGTSLSGGPEGSPYHLGGVATGHPVVPSTPMCSPMNNIPAGYSPQGGEFLIGRPSWPPTEQPVPPHMMSWIPLAPAQLSGHMYSIPPRVQQQQQQQHLAPYHPVHGVPQQLPAPVPPYASWESSPGVWQAEQATHNVQQEQLRYISEQYGTGSQTFQAMAGGMFGQQLGKPEYSQLPVAPDGGSSIVEGTGGQQQQCKPPGRRRRRGCRGGGRAKAAALALKQKLEILQQQQQQQEQQDQQQGEEEGGEDEHDEENGSDEGEEGSMQPSKLQEQAG